MTNSYSYILNTYKCSLSKLGLFLLDTLFPVYCLGCQKELGVESDYFCNECFQNFPVSESFSCPVCLARMPEGKICRGCRKKTNLSRFFYAARYENQSIRDYLHRFKYQGAKIFSIQLAKLIIKTLKENGIDEILVKNKDAVLIVPVPLHNKKLRERGFNQSTEIAKHIAREFGLILSTDILQRTKETEPQAEIKNNKERKENVKNCFRCQNKETVQNKIVILLDDVYTTGATMEECARVLKETGAKEIWGMVVAKG